MTFEKKSYTIDIQGKLYRIISDEPELIMSSAVSLVHATVNDIISMMTIAPGSNKKIEAERLAVLATVCIARELISSRLKNNEQCDRCLALIETIDQEQII